MRQQDSQSPRPKRPKRQRRFKIAVNLVIIFAGMELIEHTYATQTAFSEQRVEHDLSVLKAMYIAFIAGLFLNYASTIADEIDGINLRSAREIGAVLLFFAITFMLNVVVIDVLLKYV